MKFQLPWTVCRVCLVKGQMHSLFQKDNTGMTIADKLEIVADIKIVPDKTLPEEICRRCAILLNSAHQFQIQCKKSEFLLQMSVKHKDKLEKGGKEHAVILTLNNGKIYKMPKGVTLKTSSCVIHEEASSNNPSFDDGRSQKLVDGNGRSKRTNNIREKHSANDKTPNKFIDSMDGVDRRRTKPSWDSDQMSPESNKQNRILVLRNATNEASFDSGELENSCKPPPKRKLHILGNILLGRLPTNSYTEITNIPKIELSVTEAEAKPTDLDGTLLKGKNSLGCKTQQKGSKEKLFICELCANQYKSKLGFNLHMRRHRNDKPYECEICSAKFVQSSTLTSHMRRHTGEKPYKCRFCSRQFAKNESKLLHERMHTGEKPYGCNICNKKFSNCSTLGRHKRIHTNEEKSFLCTPCGKRFRFKYHLVAHLKTASHRCPQI